VSFTIRCTVMQTPARDRVEVRRHVRIAVDDDGRIVSVDEVGPTGAADVVLDDSIVVIPGLIDTHIHAPQWPQLGTGLDLDLESWLFEYTFPLEQRLTDPAVAAEVWPAMVSTLLAHGTTTAVYYATVDVATTTMLAEACVHAGQRAFVGRVAMDHPEGTPTWYRDVDAGSGIRKSAAPIRDIGAFGSTLVGPIRNPPFPPCSSTTIAPPDNPAPLHVCSPPS